MPILASFKLKSHFHPLVIKCTRVPIATSKSAKSKHLQLNKYLCLCERINTKEEKAKGTKK